MTEYRRKGRARGSLVSSQQSRRHSYRGPPESYQFHRSGACNSALRSPRARHHNNGRISKTPGSRATESQQHTRPSSYVIRSVYEGMRASAARLEDALVTLNANLERIAPDPNDMPYSPTMGTVVYVPVPHPTSTVNQRFNSAPPAPTSFHQVDSRDEDARTGIDPISIAPKPPGSHATLVCPGKHQSNDTESSTTVAQGSTQPVLSARTQQSIKHGFFCGSSNKRVDMRPLVQEKMNISFISPPNQNQNQNQGSHDLPQLQYCPRQRGPVNTNTNTFLNQPLRNFHDPASDLWATPNSNHSSNAGTLVNFILPQPSQRRKSNDEGRMQGIQLENFQLGHKMRQDAHITR